MVRPAAPAVGRTDLDEYAIRGAARVGGGLLSALEGIDENEKTDRRMALRGFAERLEIGTTDLLVWSTLVAPRTPPSGPPGSWRCTRPGDEIVSRCSVRRSEDP